jgi:hypothetical protein
MASGLTTGTGITRAMNNNTELKELNGYGISESLYHRGALGMGWREIARGHIAWLAGPPDDPIVAELHRVAIGGWLGTLRHPPRTLRPPLEREVGRAIDRLYDAIADGPLSTRWIEGTGLPQRCGWVRSAGRYSERLPGPPPAVNDRTGAPGLGCNRWVATASHYLYPLEVVQLPVGRNNRLGYIAFVNALPVSHSSRPFTVFSTPERGMIAAEARLARCRGGPIELDQVPNLDNALDCVTGFFRSW